MKDVVGKRLKDLRGDRSRKEVAKECGIALSTLQSYEDGSRVPRDEIKMRLADYFGVSVESLFYKRD